MLFGTYGAWLKESVVPVVNLIRLPKTFSSSLNDVCHDFTEKKGKRHQRFIVMPKQNSAEQGLNLTVHFRKNAILAHTDNNCWIVSCKSGFGLKSFLREAKHGLRRVGSSEFLEMR